MARLADSFPGPAYQRLVQSGACRLRKAVDAAPGAGPGAVFLAAAGLAAAAGAGQAAGAEPGVAGASFAVSLVLASAAGVWAASGLTSAGAAVRAFRNPDSPAARAASAAALMWVLLAAQCVLAPVLRPSGIAAFLLGSETVLVATIAAVAHASILPAGRGGFRGLWRPVACGAAGAFALGSLLFGSVWAAAGHGSVEAPCLVLALGAASSAWRLVFVLGTGPAGAGQAPAYGAGAARAGSAVRAVASFLPAPAMLAILAALGPGAGFLFFPAAAVALAAGYPGQRNPANSR